MTTTQSVGDTSRVLDGLDASRRAAWAKFYELRRDLISELAQIDAARISIRYPPNPPEGPTDASSGAAVRELLTARYRLAKMVGSMSDAEEDIYSVESFKADESRGWVRYEPFVKRALGPFIVPMMRTEWLPSPTHAYVFDGTGTHVVSTPGHTDNPYDQLSAWIWEGSTISAACGRSVHEPGVSLDHYGHASSVQMGTRYDQPMCLGCLDSYTQGCCESANP